MPLSIYLHREVPIWEYRDSVVGIRGRVDLLLIDTVGRQTGFVNGKFLDEKDDKFNYGKQRRREKEAEVFAAYLLIPEDKINEKLREEWVRESPDPIPELAEEIQVSENFMRKRPRFKGNPSVIEI